MARLLNFILLWGTLFLPLGSVFSQQVKPSPRAAINLQGNLMGTADTMVSVLSDAYRQFGQSTENETALRVLKQDAIITVSAVFNHAASPNPYRGLIDLIIMVKLHRSVYEGLHLPRFGEEIRPLVDMWRSLEERMSDVARVYLSKEQLANLDAIVQEFRETYPDQTSVSYVRVGDLPPSASRASLLGLVNNLNPFAGVADASTQIEQTRFMAERAIYLASRLPLLTGAFADLWLERLMENPEVLKSTDSFERLTLSIEALQQEYSREDLQAFISTEREAALAQFMKEFSTEREDAINQLIEANIDLEPMLTAMAQTFANAEATVLALESLSQTLGLDEPASPPDPDAEPFDPLQYEGLLHELGTASAELANLAETLLEIQRVETAPGQTGVITQSVDLITKDISNLVDHIFWRTLILIVVALILALAVGLLIKKL